MSNHPGQDERPTAGLVCSRAPAQQAGGGGHGAPFGLAGAEPVAVDRPPAAPLGVVPPRIAHRSRVARASARQGPGPGSADGSPPRPRPAPSWPPGARGCWARRTARPWPASRRPGPAGRGRRRAAVVDGSWLPPRCRAGQADRAEQAAAGLVRLELVFQLPRSRPQPHQLEAAAGGQGDGQQPGAPAGGMLAQPAGQSTAQCVVEANPRGLLVSPVA
jgi:hypothetical protein